LNASLNCLAKKGAFTPCQVVGSSSGTSSLPVPSASVAASVGSTPCAASARHIDTMLLLGPP
jgi:hypothetical protein